MLFFLFLSLVNSQSITGGSIESVSSTQSISINPNATAGQLIVIAFFLPQSTSTINCDYYTSFTQAVSLQIFYKISDGTDNTICSSEDSDSFSYKVVKISGINTSNPVRQIRYIANLGNDGANPSLSLKKVVAFPRNLVLFSVSSNIGHLNQRLSIRPAIFRPLSHDTIMADSFINFNIDYTFNNTASKITVAATNADSYDIYLYLVLMPLNLV